MGACVAQKPHILFSWWDFCSVLITSWWSLSPLFCRTQCPKRIFVYLTIEQFAISILPQSFLNEFGPEKTVAYLDRSSLVLREPSCKTLATHLTFQWVIVTKLFNSILTFKQRLKLLGNAKCVKGHHHFHWFWFQLARHYAEIRIPSHEVNEKNKNTDKKLCNIVHISKTFCSLLKTWNIPSAK